MRYKLTISYDGTNYCGWQVQKNGRSIQALIQQALEKNLRHPVGVTGSGRTDAGVHAKGQTAHFDTDIELDKRHFPLTLNTLLPNDIRIKSIENVPPDFHARYSAKRKIYHYHLYLSRIMDPFSKLYSHHVRGKFDEAKLREAAKAFVGTHNFTSFANVKKEGLLNATRTLFRLDVVQQENAICLEFEGDGFLYKMVRNITGTLLDIAQNRIELSELFHIFAAEDRKKAGQAAPPTGLFLEKVIY